MPQKPSKALTQKWNFFVNSEDKLNYLMALAKCGKQRCQSAGVRAFMYLYSTDKEVQDKVNAIIDDFLVYKENGEVSKL